MPARRSSDLLGASDQAGALVLALTATALPALDSALDALFSTDFGLISGWADGCGATTGSSPRSCLRAYFSP